MTSAVERLHAFEDFTALVTQRSSSLAYATRIRRTLDPFVGDPEGDEEAVDQILRVYALTLFAHRAFWMRRALETPLRVYRDNLAEHAASRHDHDARSNALALFLRRLESPRAVLLDRPCKVRDVLAPFLDDADRDRPAVDLIADAHASISLASDFPVGRMLAPWGLALSSHRATKKLDAAHDRLRRFAEPPPVTVDLGFARVSQRELPSGMEGWAHRDRCIGIRATYSIEAIEGCRLAKAWLEIRFVDDRVSLTIMDIAVASDGIERSVDTTSFDKDVRERSRGLSAKIDVGMPAPLPDLLTGEAHASMSHVSKLGRETETREWTRGRMIRTHRATGNVAVLELQPPLGVSAPGDGAPALSVELSFEATVPRHATVLDVTSRFSVEAGFYTGVGTQRDQLELPPL
jgi:hypothetical protein